MSKRKPLTNKRGEVRELTAADFKRAVPLSELPRSLRAKIGKRGPQKSPTKARITIRLSRDVIDPFRATGAGWQTRLNSALRDWLKRHSPAGRVR